mgnify:CR=1 FL=1
MDVRNFPPPISEEPAQTLIFAMTPAKLSRIIGGAVLSTAGLYFLSVGRRDADPKKMVLGAAMVLASCFLFF